MLSSPPTPPIPPGFWGHDKYDRYVPDSPGGAHDRYRPDWVRDRGRGRGRGLDSDRGGDRSRSRSPRRYQDTPYERRVTDRYVPARSRSPVRQPRRRMSPEPMGRVTSMRASTRYPPNIPYVPLPPALLPFAPQSQSQRQRQANTKTSFLTYSDGPPPAPQRPSNAPRVEPGNVLGVFGLSIRTRERDLEDEFGRFGDIEKVVIVYDQRVSDRNRVPWSGGFRLDADSDSRPTAPAALASLRCAKSKARQSALRT
jgi:hypothetical protein